MIILCVGQIEARFNELRLRLKTTEYANEDLEKYHRVWMDMGLR